MQPALMNVDVKEKKSIIDFDAQVSSYDIFYFIKPANRDSCNIFYYSQLIKRRTINIHSVIFFQTTNTFYIHILQR